MQWYIFLCGARALSSLSAGTLLQEQTQGKTKSCDCNRSHSLSPFPNERDSFNRSPFNRKVAVATSALTYMHTYCRGGFLSICIISTYPVSKLFMVINPSTAQKNMAGIILMSSDNSVFTSALAESFPKNKNWRGDTEVSGVSGIQCLLI